MRKNNFKYHIKNVTVRMLVSAGSRKLIFTAESKKIHICYRWAACLKQLAQRRWCPDVTAF